MMRHRWLLYTLFALCCNGTLLADESPVLEEIQAYLDFATYGEGAISSEQVNEAGLSAFQFIDTRNAQQYAKEHLADAMNIEWREILLRRDEIPKERPVVLYCDTGLLSSKAQFMLRLAGFDNVKVLLGGFDAWRSYRSDIKK
ncbi:MAG: rhodanese-like domain-containing protein [Candidatus Thiodiazotropha sp.]|jgi:rhodanese-related sulfurtransferase